MLQKTYRDAHPGVSLGYYLGHQGCLAFCTDLARAGHFLAELDLPIHLAATGEQQGRRCSAMRIMNAACGTIFVLAC